MLSFLQQAFYQEILRPARSGALNDGIKRFFAVLKMTAVRLGLKKSWKPVFSILLSFLLILQSGVGLYAPVPVAYASSSWTQSDWSGGSGQSAWNDTTRFDSSSNLDTTRQHGQLTLTPQNEKFTNPGLESNVDGWSAQTTPVLNSIGEDSAAAYSLRKLRADYAGSAVRVRRSTDNAEQDIGFNGEDFDATAFNNFVGGGNGFVATWYDQSGNGHNATQSTATNQPQIVLNVVNGRAVARFDGSNDYLTNSDFFHATAYHKLAVYKSVTPFTDSPKLISLVLLPANSTKNTRHELMLSDSGSYKHISFTANHPNSGITAKGADVAGVHNNYNVLAQSWNGDDRSITGNYGLHFNGSALTVEDSDTFGYNTATPFAIGYRAGMDRFPFKGDILELIIYPTALSNAGRETVEGNQGEYYGISVAGGSGSAPTLTHETDTTYNDSSGAARVVTNGLKSTFTQTVNVGDTATYKLQAYARKTDGSAITKTDVELYAHGSTLDTVIENVGDGWHKLTARLTGADEERQYGVEIKADKTIILDNFSLTPQKLANPLFTSDLNDWEISGGSGTAVKTAIVRAAANTSTGNQDFTKSGFGTPKAAMFIVTGGITDGAVEDHARLNLGITDGTTQLFVHGRTRHNVATTETSRDEASGSVIRLLQPDSTSLEARADFVEWITDGVRINWSTAPGSAYQVTVILFGGVDLEAKIGSFDHDGNADTAINVDVGFVPDALIAIANQEFRTGVRAHHRVVTGYAVNANPIQQSSGQFLNTNNLSSSLARTITSNNRIYMEPFSPHFEVTDFISSPVEGFEVTKRNSNARRTMRWLALKFNGAAQAWTGVIDTPTATGNQAITAPGFTPQLVQMGMNTATAVNEHIDEGAWGLSTFTADDETSNSMTDEHNAGTSVAKSLTDSKAVNQRLHNDTAGFVADFVSMDANGWTLNFTTTQTDAARKWPAFAIEEVGNLTERVTDTTYAGSAAAAKLSIGDTASTFTQTLNLGGAETYNLVAYAKKDGGGAVSADDVELYYNGSTISTTYESVGSDWYKLSALLTGANESRDFGVEVKAGKTIFVDNFSLDAYHHGSGTLTSSIFDSGQQSNWNTLTYTADTPSGTSVLVKVRTSENSDMSGATAFASCGAIASGATMSDNDCVTDTHRYVQYQVSLSTTDPGVSPTFEDISLAYATAFPAAPSDLTASEVAVNTITWQFTDNATNEDGFRVKDTGGSTVCTVNTAASGTGETVTCTETGLSPNTGYTRQVVAFNSAGESSLSASSTAITLSTPPTTGNVTSDKSTGTWYRKASTSSEGVQTGDIFTFTHTINNGAFGAGGVDYFRYAWNKSSTHTFTGSETKWESGSLALTADSDSSAWHLHLAGYNSSDIQNGTVSIGPFFYDNTRPGTPGLKAPADGSYTQTAHPTFEFEKTTDNLSGVDKYVITVNPGEADELNLVGDIPHSHGSSSIDESHRLITYSGDTISVKSRGSDRALDEGEHTWRVTAYDKAGNSRTSGTRTVFVDRTPPTVSDLGFAQSLAIRDGYHILTNRQPTLTGTITDNIAPDKVKVSYYRQHFFLGVETSRTLILTKTETLANTENRKELAFSITTPQELDYGSYIAEVEGEDKAGHVSETVTTRLRLMTPAQARTLLRDEPEALEEIERELREEPTISLPELEKKVRERRELEAEEMRSLMESLRELGEEVGSIWDWLIEVLIGAGEGAVDITRSSLVWMGDRLSGVGEGVSRAASGSLAWVGDRLSGVGEGVGRAGIWLAGLALDLMPEAIEERLLAGYTLLERINNRLLLAQERFKDRALKESKLVQERTADIIAFGAGMIGEPGSVLERINERMALSQERAGERMEETSAVFSRQVGKIWMGIELAVAGMRDPVDSAIGFAGRAKVGWDTFYAIVFDDSPTVISNVTLEEIGRDYAVVSWETNHPAWSKVNYGLDLTYGKEVIMMERRTYHVARLEGLEPDTRYFFEVMSQNKNFTYDAFYSFETAP